MTTPKVEDTRSIAQLPKELSSNLKAFLDNVETIISYEPFKPILDRVLIRRVEDAPTGKMAVPDKFRQHTNKGVVVEIGDFVVLGGERVALSHFLKPGDIVLFGEYNAERFVKDGEELWLVRIQMIRGVERVKE